jgi:site-specific DNA-cytosine methylase
MDEDQDVMNEFGDIHYFLNDEMRVRIIKTINNTQSTNSTNRVYGTGSTIHALTTQGSHPGNFGAVLYSSLIPYDFPLRKTLKGVKDISKLSFDFDFNSIRLATPREVFRLMGFSDSAFEFAKDYMKTNKISINKSYHVAGNSIVVPVLESIFKDIYVKSV